MWPNELEPIDFAARREKFLKALRGAVAVFPSASRQVRNHDVHHPFRQESNFYYLTGFEEPESLALFHPRGKAPFTLFVEPREPTREMWDGRITGPEAAKSEFGADAAFASSPENHFDDALIAALCESERLYYRVGVDRELDARIFRVMQAALKKVGRTGRALWPILDPMEILSEQRLFKSRSEIARLSTAAHISAEAHVSAMRLAKPGMYEYEIEAVLYHAFRVHGAARLGYNSVVASGANACVLHYVSNQRKMLEKDLLLVDAGAEYDYYTADITRTCPVGGTFTDAQREVYQAVLSAQKAAIAVARPGKTLSDVHNAAVEVLVEELRRMKILKGQTRQILKNREYRAYYPHATSHWLGMDVHDAGRYTEGRAASHRKLAPGMVFTVEPGLYFSPESSAPAKYKGIGVRIEDDVLVTTKGTQVLTSGVPKEVDEVESLCSQA